DDRRRARNRRRCYRAVRRARRGGARRRAHTIARLADCTDAHAADGVSADRAHAFIVDRIFYGDGVARAAARVGKCLGELLFGFLNARRVYGFVSDGGLGVAVELCRSLLTGSLEPPGFALARAA